MVGESQLALRLGGAVWEFWCLRGHFAEGWRRLDELLGIDDQPTLARAKALTGAVHLGFGESSPAKATQRGRAEQALALYRELGEAWEQGRSLTADEAVALALDAGDP